MCGAKDAPDAIAGQLANDLDRWQPVITVEDLAALLREPDQVEAKDEAAIPGQPRP